MTPGRTIAATALTLLVSVVSAWAADRPVPAEPWEPHVRAIDEALAEGNLIAAIRQWNEGYGHALRSRRWVGLVEMGDAYLRIGATGKFEWSARAVARQAYLEALVRAQAQRSVEGALRAAAAFDDLGDAEVVEQCVRIAEGLARHRGDPASREQVLRAREQITNRFAGGQKWQP